MTVVKLQLTKGQVAKVDKRDMQLIGELSPWFATWNGSRWYAGATRPQGGMVRLHTFLTGWPLVDHINGDGLDNTRANLRPATKAQNNANSVIHSHNTSGYKGVSLHLATGLWRAYVGGSRDREWLGYFRSPEEAARAYDAAALARYGEFARPNFPNGATS